MNVNASAKEKYSASRGSTSTLASSTSTTSNKRRSLLNKLSQGIQFIRERFAPINCVLSEEQIEMLKDQTNFTEDEILDWYVSFVDFSKRKSMNMPCSLLHSRHKRFLDDCPHGYMTKKQFIIMHKALFPKCDAERFARHVFRAFDLDQSNTIDFREFLVGASMTSSTSSPEKKLEWTFNVFDIDKNGLLTRCECLEVIECIVRFIHSSQLEQSHVNLEQLINRSKRSMMKIFDTLTGIQCDQLTKSQFVQGCLKDEFIAQLLAPESVSNTSCNSISSTTNPT